MTKISYNFTRKAEQNDLIEISSRQNLRFKEREGTPEILHLNLGFTGEDSGTQTSGSCSDGPRSFRSPVAATERPEHAVTSLALLSRFIEVIVTLRTSSTKQGRCCHLPFESVDFQATTDLSFVLFSVTAISLTSPAQLRFPKSRCKQTQQGTCPFSEWLLIFLSFLIRFLLGLKCREEFYQAFNSSLAI